MSDLSVPQLKPAADGWCLPGAQVEALAAAYAASPRAYHNFDHVQAVLRHYHVIALAPGWRQPREIYLALCYHDAIYLPGARQSAAGAECGVISIARAPQPRQDGWRGLNPAFDRANGGTE